MSHLDDANEHRAGLRSLSRWTLFGVISLLGCASVWASIAKIDTAVVAVGEIRPGGHSQPILQLEGGTIAEVNVVDGDTVKVDDPLFRLEDDGRKGEMQLLKISYQELQVQKAYLQARATRRDRLDIPKSVQSGKDPIRSIVDEYQRLLASNSESTYAVQGANARRIEAQDANVSRSADDVSDIEQAVDTVNRRINDVDDANDVLRRQLRESKKALQAELRGAKQAHRAARDSASEVRSEISATEGQTASEIQTSVTEVETKLAQARVQLEQAKDRVEALTITSPLTGTIHQTQLLTPGTRLSPGDVPIEVVPASGEMTALLRVQPSDIDAVREGDSAAIKLSAFAPGTVPDLKGATSMVASAPDANGAADSSSYAVEVEIPASDLDIASLRDRIVPGMPVEAFFTTGRTRVIAYLTDPLISQIRRSAPG